MPALEEALTRGFDAAWFSRVPHPADRGERQPGSAFDRAWDEAFHGRPAVSLCVYIVEDADGGERERRIDALGPIHDGLLVPGAAGAELIRTRE